MNIGINDLDDDDIIMSSQQQEQELNQEINNPNFHEQNDEDDYMQDFLRTRGINDISKIKFEDENGNIEERTWDSLTKEEKLNILNTPLETTEENNQYNELSQEEIQLLNTIRESNLTPSQYIAQFQQNETNQEPQYKIDDLSDDEIFLLDLESRVGDLTDEVAAQALANAKQNEELFNKQVEGIRKEYKEREDYQLQQQEAELAQQQEEAYNKFQESIIGSIDNFNTVGNLDLNFEDSDREELAQFILSRDEAGNNYLWQALQDPDTLVKAAWFILNGDEALNNISDYFVKQIKLISENQYKKGLEDGKNGKTSFTKPSVVIKQNNNHRSYSDINDLDDDD